MLALALVLNLVSHFVMGEISSSFLTLKSNEIIKLSKLDDKNEIYNVQKEYYDLIRDKQLRQKRISKSFNIITLVLLSLGIINCVFFVSLNI